MVGSALEHRSVSARSCWVSQYKVDGLKSLQSLYDHLSWSQRRYRTPSIACRSSFHCHTRLVILFCRTLSRPTSGFPTLPLRVNSSNSAPGAQKAVSEVQIWKHQSLRRRYRAKQQAPKEDSPGIMALVSCRTCTVSRVYLHCGQTCLRPHR